MQAPMSEVQSLRPSPTYPLYLCNVPTAQGKQVAIKSLPKVRGKLTKEKTLEKL